MCTILYWNVIVIPWQTRENISSQMSSYNHFLSEYKSKFQFAAFIDLDELIFPTTQTNFLDFLDSIPATVGAIAINQRVFGSSGKTTYEPDLLLKRFHKCSRPDYGENKYVKSIYRLQAIERISNCHASPLKIGEYVHVDFTDATFREDKPGSTEKICLSPFQINHYIIN